MTTLIYDQRAEDQLRSQRTETGADRWDEVWEGVYVKNPLPNNEHQEVLLGLAHVLYEAVDIAGLGKAYPGVNVSDNKEHWEHNYRCPDVAVFLNDSKAENCQNFWFGGPDFAVEVVSPNDTVREKLRFYEKVAARELLIVDRDPWQLELYQLVDGKLVVSETADVAQPTWLESKVVPLRLRLQAGSTRPAIEVAHAEQDKTWRI